MNKLVLIITCLLLSSNYTIAQNLTLGQVLEVKKKDLGNAEEYLSLKGWEFLEASEPVNNNLGSATFTYNKDNMSSVAESFLTFYYDKYNLTARVKVQINKISKYNEYLNTIRGYGCKMLSSEVKNGRIIKVYRGATMTFVIRSGTSENFFNEETAIWTIFIVSNDDYDMNFGDE
ncbi:MAG: hypothetical protein RBQ97_08625 [Acholeplasma sp.]|nr:hypothetical protein [Acholeplasma sp.]